MSFKSTALGMLLAASSLFCANAAMAQPAVLKFAFFTNETEKTWVTTLRPFIDEVNKNGTGVVQIDPFVNGALGRNLAQQAQMVLDGVADIAFLVPGLTPGRFPENAVLELPGLFEDTREATLVFTKLVNAGMLKGYEDYFVVGSFGSAPESIHTRIPIATYKDLRGKKIRGTNPTSANLLRTMGAASVLLPTNEVAEAIARGTIDGTLLQPIPLADFGIARVVTYHYFPRLGITPLVALMNRQKFDAMPKPAQDVLRKYSGTWIGERYIDGIGGYNDQLVKEFAADPKRKVVIPPAAEMAELQAIYAGTITEWTAQSPRNAELLTVVRAELGRLRATR